MKKIVASVGLLALGAYGLQQTASAQTLSGGPDASKPWSVAATLRGFYDDNINTTTGANRVGAFGYEVSPSAVLSWSRDQNTANLGYTYSMKQYDHTLAGNSDRFVHSHTFNADLTHNFDENNKGSVHESLVVGQEPDALRADNTFSTFQRVSGDNIRNYGGVAFDGKLSPKTGYGISYDNSFYDYQDTRSKVDPSQASFNPGTGAVLNRIEHSLTFEGRYDFQPETTGLLGARLRETDYTGDARIGGQDGASGTAVVHSDDRNTREVTPYVGLSHVFTPQLSGSADVGANYIDYYNDSSASGEWSPFVTMSGRYTYATESFVEVGFTEDRSATDEVGYNSTATLKNAFTQDQQASVLFANLTHRITPKLFGTLSAQFQNSTFNGGLYDNQSEQFYLFGANLEYRFNQYFSTQLGYDFDDLDSQIGGRSFHRNRVYLGVTARY